MVISVHTQYNPTVFNLKRFGLVIEYGLLFTQFILNTILIIRYVNILTSNILHTTYSMYNNKNDNDNYDDDYFNEKKVVTTINLLQLLIFICNNHNLNSLLYNFYYMKCSSFYYRTIHCHRWRKGLRYW